MMQILKFVVLAVVLFIGWQALLYRLEGGLRVVDEQTNPPLSEAYFRYYRPLIENVDKFNFYEKWSYWRAMRKFPTIKECLKPEGQDDLDMNAFNWKSMRSDAQAEICLHHVSVQLGDLDKLAAWLEGQGYRVLRSSGTNTGLEAIWSHDRHGTYSPFSKFSRWVLGEISPFVTGGINIQYRFEPSKRPKGYPYETELSFTVSSI